MLAVVLEVAEQDGVRPAVDNDRGNGRQTGPVLDREGRWRDVSEKEAAGSLDLVSES